MSAVIALEVVSIDSGEVVHRMPIKPDTDERMLERVERGLLMQIDRDERFVRRVEGAES